MQNPRTKAIMPLDLVPGFEVTCVIGRVEFGENGIHPHAAAMRLIGEHNAPGVYRFPGEHGGDVVVTVAFEDEVSR